MSLENKLVIDKYDFPGNAVKLALWVESQFKEFGLPGETSVDAAYNFIIKIRDSYKVLSNKGFVNLHPKLTIYYNTEGTLSFEFDTIKEKVEAYNEKQKIRLNDLNKPFSTKYENITTKVIQELNSSTKKLK